MTRFYVEERFDYYIDAGDEEDARTALADVTVHIPIESDAPFRTFSVIGSEVLDFGPADSPDPTRQAKDGTPIVDKRKESK